MANRERRRWAAEGYWWGATVKGNPRKKETPTCLSNMKEPKVGRGFGWCGCGAVGRWYHKSHELTWGSWVESFMDAHRHDRWSEHAHWATAHRPMGKSVLRWVAWVAYLSCSLCYCFIFPVFPSIFLLFIYVRASECVCIYVGYSQDSQDTRTHKHSGKVTAIRATS